MSRPEHIRLPAPSQLPSPSRNRKLKGRIASVNLPRTTEPQSARRRRASISGLTAAGPLKSQRTSKTSHRLVNLPEAPQTKPIGEDDDVLGYETDAGVRMRDYKSQAERMSKEQRERAGMKRATAYCIAESLKIKLLASFLKREHNVTPRIFDDACYVMYHLPLLPGYGPYANVRSSAPVKTDDGKSILARLSEAEEMGYQGSYFTSQADPSHDDGYMTSSSPINERQPLIQRTPNSVVTEISDELNSAAFSTTSYISSSPETVRQQREPSPSRGYQTREPEQENAEVVFFEYGVVVFFGLTESEEKSVLEDIENAGILRRKISDNRWEIEECHFTHDPNIAYPRVYNDFFTLKSRSHLLKLSIAHALAQSTLLAHFETSAQRVLSSPETLAIPQQLAVKGALQLKRREALKLTGRLFTLRRDVNLVSNVLDVPELFWDEASLKELYDAVREYMEISGRVQVLNEKLGTASDFLEAIHDHLNNSAMERITWIVIWLIVVAILVELGEVIARLAVHATTVGGSKGMVASAALDITREDVLRTLDKMSLSS
ncbi:hypothetical protein D9757_005859 [Collybiopsis confluens]|uniref:DUF155 domain-containing protein n=1 Tax=Collybiopsis confluens TaxID=2823264 RepID=A0A8H5HNT2_9AGAR|nr:hypothetical protein D9757_005859 [Collybiopsis confluens]